MRLSDDLRWEDEGPSPQLTAFKKRLKRLETEGPPEVKSVDSGSGPERPSPYDEGEEAMSPTTPSTPTSVLEKIAAVSREIGPIVKSAENTYHHNKYVPLEQIQELLKPLLESHGLVVNDRVDNGTLWTVVTELSTGETQASGIPLPQDENPQKVTGAVTYYKRCNRACLFDLQLVGEDDDGNVASGRSQAPQRQAQTAPPRAQERPSQPRGESKSDDGPPGYSDFPSQVKTHRQATAKLWAACQLVGGDVSPWEKKRGEFTERALAKQNLLVTVLGAQCLNESNVPSMDRIRGIPPQEVLELVNNNLNDAVQSMVPF